MCSICHFGRLQLVEQWKLQDRWFREDRISSLHSLQIPLISHILVPMLQDISQENSFS